MPAPIVAELREAARYHLRDQHELLLRASVEIERLAADPMRQKLLCGHTPMDSAASVDGKCLLCAGLRARDEWDALRAVEAVFRELITWQGVDHDDDCPEDDTCRCEHVAKVNAVFAALDDVRRTL